MCYNSFKMTSNWLHLQDNIINSRPRIKNNQYFKLIRKKLFSQGLSRKCHLYNHNHKLNIRNSNLPVWNHIEILIDLHIYLN